MACHYLLLMFTANARCLSNNDVRSLFDAIMIITTHSVDGMSSVVRK
jgi:hypothetical protein